MRSQCPICLYVVRDPQQTPCCGKVFCKKCISKISEEYKYCPTCKAEDFHYFPDKGLQQELYSSKVFCTYKPGGCDWQGELRELERGHLNSNQDKMALEGCKFVPVKCLHCKESYPRGNIDEHQSSKCGRRPFTCPICDEYKSTYDDVTSLHQPGCNYRPVDCPNRCGQVMHHRKLKEHLSSECELSEVECEFSHAGCEAKMLRRDVPSHRVDCVVKHLSLLATENKKLRAQLQDRTAKIEDRVADLELKSSCTFLTTLCIQYPWEDYAHCHSGTLLVSVTVRDAKTQWLSRPFCYHKSHQLQLCVWFTTKHGDQMRELCFKYIRVNYYPNTLVISTSIKDYYNDKNYFQKKVRCAGTESETVRIPAISGAKVFGAFQESAIIPFCINSVEEVRIL